MAPAAWPLLHGPCGCSSGMARPNSRCQIDTGSGSATAWVVLPGWVEGPGSRVRAPARASPTTGAALASASAEPWALDPGACTAPDGLPPGPWTVDPGPWTVISRGLELQRPSREKSSPLDPGPSKASATLDPGPSKASAPLAPGPSKASAPLAPGPSKASAPLDPGPKLAPASEDGERRSSRTPPTGIDDDERTWVKGQGEVRVRGVRLRLRVRLRARVTEGAWVVRVRGER